MYCKSCKTVLSKRELIVTKKFVLCPECFIIYIKEVERIRNWNKVEELDKESIERQLNIFEMEGEYNND